MITRDIQKLIESNLADKRAIILLGSRQVGKSTLTQLLVDKFKTPIAWFNGDDTDIRTMFENPTSTKLKSVIGEFKTIVIDEAQRIKNIGLCVKLIVDNIKDVKVILTGSSAFELSNKINEPLTGRKWEFKIYPLSYNEMVQHTSKLEENRMLNHRLIYGYYPEIVTMPGKEKAILKELVDGLLYRDILTWENIQKPIQLEKLVQALAFQTAQIISYHELGQYCNLNAETVERYINLLEKSYILFRMPCYSRNLRNELKKSHKIFFYDNGIRNAIINQFNPIGLRNDIGQLWENWFIAERIKFNNNNNENYANYYFWRTLAQQEVDLIEDNGNVLNAFECKWNTKKLGNITKAFSKSYPSAITNIVNPENYFEFL
jgi:uncharacterized protein